MKQLIDPHGRRVRKLRISLTDKCNLRCHYCMPLDATFMDEKKYLDANDYYDVVKELCEYGLEEVRLTGGEPLMRKSFPEIAAKLSQLPLKKIGMTTNAILLDRHLDTLKQNRIMHLNISLDSLNEENFKRITYGNHLKRILKNIEMAKEMGFHIKINAVAMRGINDHELFDFAEYSKQMQIEVRFLEVMRIGHACGPQQDQFIAANEMINRLKERYSLSRLTMQADSTSFNFKLDNGAEIGFIASESQAFCGQCSRWRLSADGMMRACLLKDDGINIKQTDAAARADIYQSLLGMKPFVRPAEVGHMMHQIGG